MTKVSRREAMLVLLGVSGCLVGCSSARLLGPKIPDLPEDCVWVELPYSFVCLYGPPYEDREPEDLQETARRVERSALSTDWVLLPWVLSYGGPSPLPQ